MEISRSLRAPCSIERLYAWVEDLARYPEWMPLVHDVQPEPTTGTAPPAWEVELRAQVGPFARSKRLRMERTVHDRPHEVVFTRAEVDGRSHSPWVLRAALTAAGAADDAATNLTMELHYGGGLWTGAVLQRVLDDEVRRGSEALIDLVSDAPTH